MHKWRERLQRWFSPLARRCPLSPNAITIVALLLNAIAASLLYSRHFLVAILFVAIGGLADAFDGIVARVQEKTSRYGDFLDHFCDRVSDLLLTAGWLLGNAVRVEIVVLAMLAVMLNGYIGTQIEATWRERNYESVGRAEFVIGLILFPFVSHLLFANEVHATRYAALTVAEWMSAGLAALALFGVMQRLSLAKKLERSR